MKIIYIFAFLAIFLVSCMPDENPFISNRTSFSETIGMGSNYSEQIYYDLENMRIVSSNPFEAWDLALNSSPELSTIVLNAAKFMKVFPVEGKSFEEVTLKDYKAIQDYQWRFDAGNGDQDSTAFGTWWQEDNKYQPKDRIYIIDRGKTAEGDAIGHWKMQILSATSESVTFKLQNLRSDEPFEATITKDDDVNFTKYSIDDKKQVKLAPNKDSWDILFTKHTELLYTSDGDSLWYGVTSLLLNPNSCRGAISYDSTYQEITYDSLSNYTFKSDINAIGHDWKYYDLEAGVYVIRYRNTYLIQSRNGYYFKLRFTSFTNNAGLKGYPQFEFEAL